MKFLLLNVGKVQILQLEHAGEGHSMVENMVSM